MSAEIIAIGSELTCGAKLDTNSQWLSRELEGIGWTVSRHVTLADDLTAMSAEFRAAASRSSVVLITGGLGPTLDDITREALAAAFDQKLISDPVSLQQIEAIFAARGRAMPERNHRQALRPEHSESIPNHCGTAPGILMRVELPGSNNHPAHRCLIGVMPGVPAEMKPMFTLQIRPHLLQSGTVVHRTMIRTFGFGESDVERRLGDLTARGRNPEVGITASEAVISLSITSRAASIEHCKEMNAHVRNEIVSKLGTAVYAEDDRELHDVVGEMLSRQQLKVAVREGSVTGGLIACWLTENQTHHGQVTSAAVLPATISSQLTVSPGQQSSRSEAELWDEFVDNQGPSLLQSEAADFVLLTSLHFGAVSEKGVALKRGFVSLFGKSRSGQQFRETHDVSMSGNLAIFRQRAARTALNSLRLAVQADSGSGTKTN